MNAPNPILRRSRARSTKRRRAATLLLAIPIFCTVVHAQAIRGYDASLGTLPEAQGFCRYDEGGPAPVVVGGALQQGPTGSYQYWHQYLPDFELSTTPVTVEWEFRVRASSRSGCRAGWSVAIQDRSHRGVAVNIDLSTISFEAGGGTGGACASASFAQGNGFHRYRLVVGTQVDLYVDGSQTPLLSTPLGPPGVTTPEYCNRVYFGDGTRHASSQTELRYLRYSPHPGIAGDYWVISLPTGGAQPIQLDAGSSHANQPYYLLGTLSGTSPGFSFGGVSVPLNLDAYSTLVLSSPNQPPLLGGFGTLDANGQATATFVIPPLPIPGPINVHHGYDGISGGTPVYASGALPGQLR
jgi:hypothetical protein